MDKVVVYWTNKDGQEHETYIEFDDLSSMTETEILASCWDVEYPDEPEDNNPFMV